MKKDMNSNPGVGGDIAKAAGPVGGPVGSGSQAAGGNGQIGLPSGRVVRVRSEGGREALEVRSADGELEIAIEMTAAGPVLRLRGARLEIDSTDEVAVRCREFNVEASGGVRLSSGGDVQVTGQGEMRMKAMGQTHIDAEVINLNSGDRSEYPDEETTRRVMEDLRQQGVPVDLVDPPRLEDGKCGDGCGCG